MIYVVTPESQGWDDSYGRHSVVANEEGDIANAVSLEKYMTSLGLQPVSSMRVNCRLIASHKRDFVTHLLVEEGTGLTYGNTRLYEPETLWISVQQNTKEPEDEALVNMGMSDEPNDLTKVIIAVIVIIVIAVIML